LEEKGPSGVVEPGKLLPKVRVKNPSFDITPLELVTGIVTENGLLTPEEVISYMNQLKAASPDIPGPGSP
jgi:methylthioribose-1-phosphate isomerase